MYLNSIFLKIFWNNVIKSWILSMKKKNTSSRRKNTNTPLLYWFQADMHAVLLWFKMSNAPRSAKSFSLDGFIDNYLIKIYMYKKFQFYQPQISNFFFMLQIVLQQLTYVILFFDPQNKGDPARSIKYSSQTGSVYF